MFKRDIKVSIIIATHERFNGLKRIYSQINKQRETVSGISIIIINDSNNNRIKTLLNEEILPTIHINGDGNWWWTKSMNAGFKKAVEINSDFVLVLNDDSEISDDYLHTLLSDYETLPSGSILGSMSVSVEHGNLVQVSGTKSFSKITRKATPYLKPYTELKSEHKGIFPSYSLSGRGTLIPTEVFKKIGYYNPLLVQYGSDDEFILRAKSYDIPCFISWNAKIYNRMYLTSKNSPLKAKSFINFTKGFLNKYSSHSLRKEIIIYWKYGVKILLPFYIIYYVLGTYKAYFINYHELKSKK